MRGSILVEDTRKIKDEWLTNTEEKEREREMRTRTSNDL